MPANHAPTLDTAYISPAEVETPAKQEGTQVAQGSLPLILIGIFLLLAGYVTSNLFLIADLYHVRFGPEGTFVPSPLAPLLPTPAAQWAAYGIAAMAVVAGCLLIGSQAFHPLAAVCYFMCPLAAGVFLVGAPLRIAKRYAFAAAALYLALGTCLAATGAFQLFRAYDMSNGGGPVVASMVTQVGFALVAGAMLKLTATAE